MSGWASGVAFNGKRFRATIHVPGGETREVALVDMGKGLANVAVRLVLDDGSHLPEMAAARFVSFGDERQLTDCALPRLDVTWSGVTKKDAFGVRAIPHRPEGRCLSRTRVMRTRKLG